MRFGAKMWFAVQEMILAGRVLPFAGAGFALLGGLLGMLPVSRASNADPGDRLANESRWASLLLLMVCVFYIVALMLTLPWFGQEDRYLLPLHPLVIVLVGIVAWRILELFPMDRLLARPVVRWGLVRGAVRLSGGC